MNWLVEATSMVILTIGITFTFLIFYLIGRETDNSKLQVVTEVLLIIALFASIIFGFVITFKSNEQAKIEQTRLKAKFSIPIATSEIVNIYSSYSSEEPNKMKKIFVRFPNDTRIYTLYIRICNEELYPYTLNISGVYVPFRFSKLR